MNVYLVQYLHLINHEEESVMTIGIFSTEEEAISAINVVNKMPGFKDFPYVIDPIKDDNIEGFYIDNYEVNNIKWKEGYSII